MKTLKSAVRNLMLVFALFLTHNMLADTTQLTPKCNEPTAEGDRACWMKVSNRDNCYVWNSEPQTNETVSWSGACMTGVAHGQGEEVWQWDGELGGGQATAFGSYMDGKAVGYWEAQFVDGTTMVGPYVDGEANGPWELRLADGAVLTGSMVDDEPHGKWEVRHGDGRIDDVMYDKGEEISRAPRFNPKFAVEGDILHYNTDLAATEESREIAPEDLEVFEKVLKENPDIKVVHLTSWGGDVETSDQIADLIIDYELDTHVVEVCYSACPTIFVGGEKRTLARGSKLGFHRGWWDADSMKEYYESEKENNGWKTVFDFASWVYEDAQEELYKKFQFLLERGVEPFFAIKTIQASPNELDGWYPRRKELRDANFLTE